MSYRFWPRLGTIAATALLTSTLHVVPPTASTPGELRWEETAQARRGGGRSGGGSFRSPSRSTSPSRSQPADSGGSSNPSRSTSPSNSGQTYNNGGSSGPVIVVPGGGPTYRSYGGSTYYGGSSSSNGFALVLGLLLLGIPLVLVLWFAYRVLRATKGKSRGNKEVDNNTVTVSKIQVALLAEARQLQADLTDLSLQVDTETPEGIQELLQETVLALLRSPETWSHVLASSQTVKSREAAETLFNQLSVAERSKFSVETLTNVGGRVQRRELKVEADQEPAAYIVVTLLVGTAHDKPLFSSIRTETELQQALQTLAALPSDYLMVFELLWTPQESSDSLSYEELLTQYTEMVQL